MSEESPQISIAHRVVGLIGYLFLQIVGKTSFVYQSDSPAAVTLRRNQAPLIYAFWHNTQVYLSYHHRNSPINVIVSRSKDGEFIAQVMEKMRIRAVRGSTSRGGEQAFRELLDWADRGQQLGFTPDGPRGPLQKVHQGVVAAAQMTGLPIVPLSVAVSRKLVFKRSWDHFFVPLPFARIVTVMGAPFEISKDMDEEEAKALVRERLNRVTLEAQEALPRQPRWIASLAGVLLYQFYRVLGLATSPLWGPVLFLKFGWKRSLAGLRERWGGGVVPRAAGKIIWFHSASLGEWQALKPLLSKFLAADVTPIITTSTVEARDFIRRENPALTCRLMPLDFPFLVKRFLKQIKPEALVIVETELWPALIQTAFRRLVPVIVVNGRLTKRSARHWRWGKPLVGRMLSQIAYCLARSDEDARRWVELGMNPRRTMTVGNLKADALTIATSEERQAFRKTLTNTGGVIIAGGSTWSGEEALLIEAVRRHSNARLMIAPRRKERFEEVAKLLSSSGMEWTRYSGIKGVKAWESQILLVDTLGDLKKLYLAADIAFVGGSYNPRGGQNPFEPASAGAAVMFGPSMSNFRTESEALVSGGGAALFGTKAGFFEMFNDLMNDGGHRQKMAVNAVESVRQSQGAAGATADLLRRELAL